MKKALVLGILAIFAINVASAQNNRTDTKPAKDTKTTKSDKEKTVKPQAASFEAEKQKAEKNEAVKPTCDPTGKNCNNNDGKKMTKDKTSESAGTVSERTNVSQKKTINKEKTAIKKTAKEKTVKESVPPTPKNKTKDNAKTGTTSGNTPTDR